MFGMFGLLDPMTFGQAILDILGELGGLTTGGNYPLG